MKQATLSLVMIIKDEAQHLKSCIETLGGLADEIIILDSGSTDNSVEIAKSLGAKVYHSTSWQGFGKQRQQAQSYASCDYILALDADERITSDLQSAISSVLEKPVSNNIVFAIKRLNYFCGKPVHRYGKYDDAIIQLYAREYFQYSDLEVHESVDYKEAKIINLNGYVKHFVCKDFYQFLAKNLRYSQDWAAENHKNGKSSNILKCIYNSIYSFFREYILRAAILGGTYGLLLALGSAHYTFNKYLFLYYLNHKKQI